MVLHSLGTRRGSRCRQIPDRRECDTCRSRQVNNPVWIRAGALYLPVMLALIAGVLRPRLPKQFAACLLSALWSAPALLAVQQFNLRAGWWRFASGGVMFRAMPLELYIGWIVLWGVLPQFAFRRLSI